MRPVYETAKNPGRTRRKLCLDNPLELRYN